VPQSDIAKMTNKLFARYKKKLEKSSVKIKAAFTHEGIRLAYTKFQQIICFSSVNGRINLPIYKLLSDPCYLLIAYSTLQDLKSAGIDNVPVANVTLGGILTLANELECRSYKPNPIRRVFIPKANGKMRPLGVASTRDKIVQQALNLILVPVFEPTFSDHSHGFRKGRSCHSVMREIYLR
jgi:hypothetical protein